MLISICNFQKRVAATRKYSNKVDQSRIGMSRNKVLSSWFTKNYSRDLRMLSVVFSKGLGGRGASS